MEALLSPCPPLAATEPSSNPEFHIRLEQLSNLDPHDGALYSTQGLVSILLGLFFKNNLFVFDDFFPAGSFAL